MTASLSRRSLLRATPVLALPAVAAVPMARADETEILRLFRQWREATSTAAALPVEDASESEFEALMADAGQIERAIASTPATCIEDLAAKVVACSGRGGFVLPAHVCLECETLLNGVVQ